MLSSWSPATNDLLLPGFYLLSRSLARHRTLWEDYLRFALLVSETGSLSYSIGRPARNQYLCEIRHCLGIVALQLCQFLKTAFEHPGAVLKMVRFPTVHLHIPKIPVSQLNNQTFQHVQLPNNCFKRISLPTTYLPNQISLPSEQLRFPSRISCLLRG